MSSPADEILGLAPLDLSGLETRWLGRTVEIHHRLSSTNDRARVLARAGAARGLAVVARAQTAGRVTAMDDKPQKRIT